MIKVVIDTNVLVSALINEHGAEAAVLDLIIDGKCLWCLSPAILAEYAATLDRPKFQQLERRKIAAALALAQSGQMTMVTVRLRHSPDESDNRFYECAHACEASYIVTGNRKHFPKDLSLTKIVSARELLAILKK